jgi:ribosomal protein L37E
MKNRRILYKQDKSKHRECKKCGKLNWPIRRGVCK